MPATVTIKRTTRRKIDPKALKGPDRVKVGFPASKSDRSVIDIAIWNEFGTRRIPERPFMRNTVRNHRTRYLTILRSSASRIVMGLTTLPVVLNKLGIQVQGDIQDEITTFRDPPNAPSTIKAKGSSNPLIDIGTMRQSVTWIVEK